MTLLPGVWAGMSEQPMDLAGHRRWSQRRQRGLRGVRRGLSVALLEAGDIGGGTSCRSTKLLHGGVRYLELAFKTLDLAQLNLVREALLEQGHWLRQAPFLAQRLELALPTGPPSWGRPTTVLASGLRRPLRPGGHRLESACCPGCPRAGLAPAEALPWSRRLQRWAVQ